MIKAYVEKKADYLDEGVFVGSIQDVVDNILDVSKRLESRGWKNLKVVWYQE